MLAAVFSLHVVFAREYFYLRNKSNCDVRTSQDSKYVQVPIDDLVHVPIDVKQLEKWPNYVTFKINEKRYIASSTCLYLANDESPEIDDTIKVIEMAPQEIVIAAPELPEVPEEVFAENNYFFDLGTGLVSISDQNQIPEDYNKFFSSDPLNPALWGEADKSAYKTESLLNIGFGIGRTNQRYFAFKFRKFTGVKTDTVSVTDINTNTTTTAEISYRDSMTSYYSGYKYIFETGTQWQPTLAGYLGLTTVKTELSHGTSLSSSSSTSSSSFTSKGFAAILEGGLEFLTKFNYGAGVSLNYEYMAPRVIVPQDSKVSNAGSKTKLNYSNITLAAGLRIYY